MRDGVNLSRMQVTRPLVMHTEVTNLPNLSGFLGFGRNLPVVRFTDSYNRVATIADGFIERDRPPSRDDEGQSLIAAIDGEVRTNAGKSRTLRASRKKAPDLFEDDPPAKDIADIDPATVPTILDVPVTPAIATE
jgi:hypothetical protein